MTGVTGMAGMAGVAGVAGVAGMAPETGNSLGSSIVFLAKLVPDPDRDVGINGP